MSKETADNYEAFHRPPFDKITDVIWDGDNTIWDWVTYASEAYPAMAQAIADETDIPEPEVAAAMKKFYTEAGTIEAEGLIQGLVAYGFFRQVPGFDQNRVIEIAKKAFDKKRNKLLHVYHGAHKVIKTIVENGIKNRLLTDAPERQAAARLKRSKAGQLMQQVNAMPSKETPDLPEKYKKKEKAGKYKYDFEVTTIPWEKPFSNLEEILKMTRDQIRRHVVIIGDNDRKDMELVRLYGCRGVHAVYGEAEKSKVEKLLRFAPEKIAKKNVALDPRLNGHGLTNGTAREHQGLIVPVKDPYEILKVLGIKSERLW